MKTSKKLFCILTALILVCATALPAFAGVGNTPVRGGTPGLGDINGNGEIDTADALLIMRRALGMIELPEELEDRCDANTDGRIDAADALLVLRTAVLPNEYTAFFMELFEDIPAYADIDGDGAEDTVLIEELGENEEMEWEYSARVTITLAASPEEPFVYEMGNYWFMSCAVADLDPDDGRLTVICSVDRDEGGKTVAFRMKADGSGFNVFTTEGFDFGTECSGYDGFPVGFGFTQDEGLPMMKRTEIFGTYYLNGRFTLTDEGFVDLSERYTYPDIWTWPLTLLRPMDVTLEDGTAYTVPTGDVVIPRYTDMASYAAVELPDGRIGTVEVSFGPDGYPVYINGIIQDEYGEIHYAD
ncbi:MAG: hypothetical protein IKG85_01485 [Clostridia bacterium]|nr:hypothetical protein [Clostridia bacterium]